MDDPAPYPGTGVPTKDLATCASGDSPRAPLPRPTTLGALSRALVRVVRKAIVGGPAPPERRAVPAKAEMAGARPEPPSSGFGTRRELDGSRVKAPCTSTDRTPRRKRGGNAESGGGRY
jgi:hypothetical protein